MPPRLHCTPPELVTETVRETVFVGDHTFRIERPTEGDKLLDHPWCRSAYAADEYVPYWPTLWPSARMLAKAVLAEDWSAFGPAPEVLEIGCGLGLAGVACLARGLRVTFSDVDETAVAFALRNAKLNGFTKGYRGMPLDFRSPPEGERFDVLLGSDLMYEERLVDPLVTLLDAVLAPTGVCLIADPDRLPARPFRYKLMQAGYDAVADFARAGEPGGERTKGTVYRVRRMRG
jgi:predicted nicotinamide N-methyase